VLRTKGDCPLFPPLLNDLAPKKVLRGISFSQCPEQLTFAPTPKPAVCRQECRARTQYKSRVGRDLIYKSARNFPRNDPLPQADTLPRDSPTSHSSWRQIVEPGANGDGAWRPPVRRNLLGRSPPLHIAWHANPAPSSDPPHLLVMDIVARMNLVAGHFQSVLLCRWLQPRTGRFPNRDTS
jgi:hypothetical protein